MVSGFFKGQFTDVDMGGAAFDLTSLDVELLKGRGSKGGTGPSVSIRSPEGDFATITTTGTATLNWTGVTSVRISADFDTKATVDNIVIGGSKKGGKPSCDVKPPHK